MSATFVLGDRVKFSRNLQRSSYAELDPRSNRTRYIKRWKPSNFIHPREGVIVGKRTIWDGERYLIGYEEGYSFLPVSHQEAYLVAFDLRRKPVFVAVEDLATAA